MKEELIAPKCGRENELIDFLYGELSEVEAQAFQHHVRNCSACNAELAAFGDVRESVVAWRNESLGAIVSPVPVTNVAAAAGNYRTAPSAASALREFFSLSPLWLKGAVAFASVLFCLFAGLAIARLQDKPATPVVTAPALSDQQLNALVEERVQAELQRSRNLEQQQPESQFRASGPSQKTLPKRIANRSEVAANATNQKARRPLSKSEREQLAADLRLTSAKSDSELDLLEDRINQ